MCRYTRGTNIAPESSPIDRNQHNPSFATPAGVTAPILLKWLLLWEDPLARALWFGRALPRLWLEDDGTSVVVRDASSAYGRVGMVLRSSFNSSSSAAAYTGKTISANLSVPASFAGAGAPAGGLILRLRAPTAVGAMTGVWKQYSRAKSNHETMNTNDQHSASDNL